MQTRTFSVFLLLALLTSCTPMATPPPSAAPTATPVPASEPSAVPTSAAMPAYETATAPPELPTEAPSPTAALEPLSILSDVETIRQRMLHSNATWHTLWCDATLTWFPPEGSDYLAQTERVQIWVQQPAQALVLRGPVDGNPNHLWVSDGTRILEADLETGSISENEMPEYVRQPFIPPDTLSDTIGPFPLGGMLGTPLSDALFPTGLAQRTGVYEVIGMDAVAGRPALIVDWTAPTGLVADRFRIDVQTGVLLRWLVLGKTGGGEHVENEYLITQIVYNVDFPSDTFSLRVPEPLQFAASAP
jgi:hypothetical protein